MNLLFPGFLSAAVLGVCASAQAESFTHCEDMSKTVFSCCIANSKKVISLCAATSSSHDEKYLQYRFGKPGNIELIFPKNNQENKDQFSFNRIYSRHYGHLRYDVEFSIGQNDYNVFWEFTNNFDEATQSWGESKTISGVRVSTFNKKITLLTCINDKDMYEDLSSSSSLLNVTNP